MLNLAQNFQNISERVKNALRKAGRAEESAKILVISKGQKLESLKSLITLGQHRFGENYAQEWKEKNQALTSHKPEWHFVGRLQSNKLKYLMGEIFLFHSLDRWELAVKMDEMAQKRNCKTSVLIEVDLADQSTKAGVSEKDLPAFVEKLNGLESIEVQGLMTFPPLSEDAENSRPYYRQLREILFEFNRKNAYKKALTELSMGMSNDYEVAAEEGATYLRIGRAIFKDDE